MSCDATKSTRTCQVSRELHQCFTNTITASLAFTLTSTSPWVTGNVSVSFKTCTPLPPLLAVHCIPPHVMLPTPAVPPPGLVSFLTSTDFDCVPRFNVTFFCGLGFASFALHNSKLETATLPSLPSSYAAYADKKERCKSMLETRTFSESPMNS